MPVVAEERVEPVMAAHEGEPFEPAGVTSCDDPDDRLFEIVMKNSPIHTAEVFEGQLASGIPGTPPALRWQTRRETLCPTAKVASQISNTPPSTRSILAESSPKSTSASKPAGICLWDRHLMPQRPTRPDELRRDGHRHTFEHVACVRRPAAARSGGRGAPDTRSAGVGPRPSRVGHTVRRRVP